MNKYEFEFRCAVRSLYNEIRKTTDMADARDNTVWLLRCISTEIESRQCVEIGFPPPTPIVGETIASLIDDRPTEAEAEP